MQECSDQNRISRIHFLKMNNFFDKSVNSNYATIVVYCKNKCKNRNVKNNSRNKR